MSPEEMARKLKKGYAIIVEEIGAPGQGGEEMLGKRKRKASMSFAPPLVAAAQTPAMMKTPSSLFGRLCCSQVTERYAPSDSGDSDSDGGVRIKRPYRRRTAGFDPGRPEDTRAWSFLEAELMAAAAEWQSAQDASQLKLPEDKVLAAAAELLQRAEGAKQQEQGEGGGPAAKEEVSAVASALLAALRRKQVGEPEAGPCAAEARGAGGGDASTAAQPAAEGAAEGAGGGLPHSAVTLAASGSTDTGPLCLNPVAAVGAPAEATQGPQGEIQPSADGPTASAAAPDPPAAPPSSASAAAAAVDPIRFFKDKPHLVDWVKGGNTEAACPTCSHTNQSSKYLYTDLWLRLSLRRP